MSKKIYLVEDDAAIIDIYATLIKKAHIDVDVISAGADVIKKLQAVQRREEAKPDLILLDLILPDMNGLDILTDIKKHPETKNIAVFILSNQSELQGGANGVKPDKFIVKANTTPTELLGIVKKELKV